MLRLFFILANMFIYEINRLAYCRLKPHVNVQI